MAFSNSKSVRFQDDLETAKSATPKTSNLFKCASTVNGRQTPKAFLKNTEASKIGKLPIEGKKLSRVFSEDYDVVQRKILDPRGTVVNRWNKCFLVACLISLFVDPLFFYLPAVKEDMCMNASVPFEIALTVIRSAVDVFYVIQIFVRFRTAYVAPSSRVFGRGELVIDSTKIASRYLRRDFWLDLLAALPLPQVLIWGAIPSIRVSTIISAKIVIRFTIIFQFLLRLYLTFPLKSQIVNATGGVVEAAWAGAAYNLMLYMLASHVPVGTFFAIERQERCWKEVCNRQRPNCQYWYFDCHTIYDANRAAWFKSSNISELCGPAGNFEYGIYAEAVAFAFTSSDFFSKYFYCLWWGLRNLSSIGQNLTTSIYSGEISFAIIIAIIGLVLFALLIGNMETYLQSTTVRLEEWRVRRTDTEEWMRHRQLPHELRESVRSYDLYKWVTTRGVDEEAILKGLPLDLRRDIKRHLCLDLVRRVPLFDQMDECMLDAICERLKPVLSTRATCLVREGDPVNEMLFIIRGHLDSYTTNGGRTGFLNSCRIGPGDFCGEELLTWALDPRPSVILPSSTRTVTALSEVEAFALIAEDVNFVAAQFRKLHSKRMRHTFRSHSHQWRTWAACFIQAAWFRYKRRKEAVKLKAKEGHAASLPEPATEKTGMSLPSKALTQLRYKRWKDAAKLVAKGGHVAHSTEPVIDQTVMALPSNVSGLAMYAATIAASVRSGSQRDASEFDLLISLQKPAEPDFTIDDR